MTSGPPIKRSTRANAPQIWRMRLYVAGQSPKSLTAYANLTRLCERHLASHYEIEVVDLVENPRLASTDDILAIPTLVRHRPAPSRRIIGDLSDTERVLAGLELAPVAQ
jgi:circadian clock protein KaiB